VPVGGFQLILAALGCRPACLAAKRAALGVRPRGSRTSATMEFSRRPRSADPHRSAYPSMNLSHAVFGHLQSLRHGGPARPHSFAVSQPAAAARSRPWSMPKRCCLEVGFLLPHTAHARWAKLRALLQRAQVLAGDEVALLRGMVSQLRWASRGQTP